MKNKNVLVISPHPDDGLFGCGGTIRKLKEQGSTINYAILSWKGQGFDRHEIVKSLREIGVDRIFRFDFPVRELPNHRNEIRDKLIEIREEIKPDLVFVHNSFDKHQDHEIVSREGYRAFREGNLLGYMLPWNLKDSRVDLFYELTKEHIDKKIKALGVLESQSWREYYKPEKILAGAVISGLCRRKDYAESFEVLNIIE